LTSSVSIYRLWRKMDGRLPSYMLGHSLGEYSALVCANAIKFCDAIKIVFLRGQLMQTAIKNRPSEMQAINGLHYKIINQIC
ncbi:acyltransferase domain-containing protein, partial [Buchnera aphidicola]|nr:acyltransferase domain-containing protein [Buchnera aphidicola]